MRGNGRPQSKLTLFSRRHVTLRLAISEMGQRWYQSRTNQVAILGGVFLLAATIILVTLDSEPSPTIIVESHTVESGPPSHSNPVSIAESLTVECELPSDSNPVFVTPGRIHLGTEHSLDDAIVGLYVATSWIDRGLRAVVFEDGSAFAYKGSADNAADGWCYAVKLDADQTSRIVGAFEDQEFFGLPTKITCEATDGTDEWLLLATPARFHVVYHYMAWNNNFEAVRQAFETTILAHLDRATKISRTQLLSEVTARMKRMPEESAKREAISKWLNLISGDVRWR